MEKLLCKIISGFPSGSVVKNMPANAGDVGSIPGSGRSPGEGRKWQPTPVFLPGKFHGQRSPAGYSPRGGKESDMTEQLTLSLSVKDVTSQETGPNPREGDPGPWHSR